MRHPALRRVARELTADAQGLVTIPGWETFNTQQKEFLCYLPWFGSKNATQDNLGLNKMWVYSSQKKNPLFQQACDQRLALKAQIVQAMGSDLVGKAMLLLKNMLDDNYPNKAIQFKAIALVLDLDGKTSKANAAPAGNQTYIKAENVQLWGQTSGEYKWNTGLKLVNSITQEPVLLEDMNVAEDDCC